MSGRPAISSPEPGAPHAAFYSVAAAAIVLISFIGFFPFYSARNGPTGPNSALIAVHATAMAAWVVLFLAQSLLISTHNKNTHRKLGWSAIGIVAVIACTGPMLAVQSVRSAPDSSLWGMQYRQFLLVMLTEIMLFTTFVLAGMLTRKRPEVHRAMMLLASLSILSGATIRMPILFGLFGERGWIGIFGPVFSLGAVFLIARSLLQRAADKWFATGYLVMIALYVGACAFAVSKTWSLWAKAAFSA